MANVKRLIELGMATELAKEVAAQIAAAGASYTDTDARDAIKTKAEVAALTSGSDAADIVAALQA